MVVVTLFIIAENLKQPLNWKEPRKWIDKFRYIHTVEHYIAELEEKPDTDTSNEDISQKYDTDQKKLDTKGLT